MSEKNETIRLACTGWPDMVFEGRRLASTDGSGPSINRWHNLALYARDDTHYVVSISYRTQWDGELAHDTVYSTTDQAGVIGALRDHDPTAVVRGYPPGEQYAEKQARLFAELRSRYAAAVSELLREADITASPDALSRCDVDVHLRRYRNLLARALRDITFTRGEACLICDALNGTAIFEQEYMFIAAEIEDSIRLNGTDEKWSVDGPALLGKLSKASATTLCAIADAAERFWQDPNRQTDEMLHEVGLLGE